MLSMLSHRPPRASRAPTIVSRALAIFGGLGEISRNSRGISRSVETLDALGGRALDTLRRSRDSIKSVDGIKNIRQIY